MTPDRATRNLLLSVIVPAFNEAGTVEAALRRVRAVPLRVEIIVVNDASTDGTREVLDKLAQDDLVERLPLSSNRFGFEVEITARLAQARARIWEMPISYSGRTYAEGKKITWRDGFAALFHIVRYNLILPRHSRDWRLPEK